MKIEKIEWTKEERYKIGVAVVEARNTGASETEAAAQAAVSLFLARVPGQVAEDAIALADILRQMKNSHDMGKSGSVLVQWDLHVPALHEFHRFAAGAQQAEALRARVAELEKAKDALEQTRLADGETINDLRAEVEGLKARNDDLRLALTERTRSFEAQKTESREQARRATAAESRLAAIRERAKDGERLRREYLAAYDKDPNLQPYQAAVAASLAVARWVLEGDAPQEAKCYAPKHINCPCGWDPPQPCHFPTPDGEPTEAAWKEAHELQKAYDRGIEAMRAACWEALREVFAEEGVPVSAPLYEKAHTAIEGAAP